MTSLKRILAATAIVSAALHAPAYAQDKTETEAAQEPIFASEEDEVSEQIAAELMEEFAMFGELFAADPLTEEQESRLPAAKELARHLMPAGSFADSIQTTMEPMFDMLFEMAIPEKTAQLSRLTGVDFEDTEELQDEQIEEALALLDPHFETRNEKLQQVILSMVGQLFGAMEPAYRKGLSRAFAVRFTEQEMADQLAFFQTPSGASFARQIVEIQYDPQLLTVMEEVGPAFVKIMPSMIEEFKTLEEDYPAARQFGDLATAERSRLAELLGKGVPELDALQPDLEEEGTDDIPEDAVY